MFLAMLFPFQLTLTEGEQEQRTLTEEELVLQETDRSLRV